MNILLSAFSCAPHRGSEPNVGWNVAMAVGRKHKVWVLTAASNCRAIEACQSPVPLDLKFIYVDLPSSLSRLETGGLLSHYLYYALWQVAAYFVARRLHREVIFDAVHHVTYVNSWVPTWLGWLGIPFIWSAGNREKVPLRFISEMSLQGKLQELTRNTVISLSRMVVNRAVAERATLILSVSGGQVWGNDLPVSRLPLGGLNTEDVNKLISMPQRVTKPFRVLSVGRLLGLKGFAAAMRAFNLLRREFPESEYWIVGEGPERSRLELLATKLGCRESVRFMDWRTRDEVFHLFAKVDVLLHPSLREQFGYVIVEAMAAGKPVICLDVGGPSVLVDNGNGCKIRAGSPDQVVLDISRILLRLAVDLEHRLALGREMRHRANSQWTWEAVGEQMLDLYDQTLSLHGTKERIQGGAIQ
jgi:glycosyltransferase involved in cell wall biosynthesis